MNKLVKVFYCLFVTVSCAEFKNDESKQNNQTNPISAMEIENFITVKVEPTAKPERYIVYFSWPKIQEDFKIRIRLGEVLSTVNPAQSTFSHEVAHDQNLTYVFDILSDTNRVQKSISKLVNIPMDLVLSTGKNELNSDLILRPKRLFLFKDAPVTSNGFKIDLIVEELISEEALIQTFSPGSKADFGNAGATPKDISIKARTAVGKLNVVMKGQDGGDGLDGVKFQFAAAAGESPGEGIRNCRCDAACRKYSAGSTCYCSKYGTSGGNGMDGLRGLPGGNAMPGGSTGNLKISVQDGKEFEISTSKIIGRAGIPGKGGPGQPGGSGGVASANINCPGPNGINGEVGNKGSDGLPSVNGLENPICIYIASEEKNECL
jgi:hypothetical protein